MVELSRTWVNRPAEISMSLPAATPDATHSAARFDAVYMSGEYRDAAGAPKPPAAVQSSQTAAPPKPTFTPNPVFTANASFTAKTPSPKKAPP